MERFGVALALVAYNNVANLWRPFRGWAYLPANVAAGGLLLALALGPLGYGAAEVGLGGDHFADAGLGLALGAALALPAFGALGHARTARLLADARLAGIGPAGIAYRALVRIPIGTALFEEVAFRGVLYAAWRPAGAETAAVATGIAFGLWHVVPTLDLVRSNRPSAGARRRAATVAAGVVVTAGAGMLLACLREKTGGIAAPAALHAALNSLTAVAAFLGHRRSRAGVQ